MAHDTGVMTPDQVCRTMVYMQTETSERTRIALEIRAVVEPYRDHLVRDDATVRTGYRRRARSVLDGLNTAVLPFPDLQQSLSAARAELELQ